MNPEDRREAILCALKDRVLEIIRDKPFEYERDVEITFDNDGTTHFQLTIEADLSTEDLEEVYGIWVYSKGS